MIGQISPQSINVPSITPMSLKYCVVVKCLLVKILSTPPANWQGGTLLIATSRQKGSLSYLICIVPCTNERVSYIFFIFRITDTILLNYLIELLLKIYVLFSSIILPVLVNMYF